MSDIVKINDNEIPSDAKLFKINNITKNIYLKSDIYTTGSLPIGRGESCVIAEGKTEKVEISSERVHSQILWQVKIKLYKNNSLIKELLVAEDDAENINANNSYKIVLDESVTIKKDFSTYAYYIESPPEIITVDKAPSTTTLSDITNYINKTTESIKSCKSYIAYVINNKGGSAKDTETLESLINKLKNIKF